MVGLSNGEVRIYNETTLLDVIPGPFPVAAIVFGHVFRGTYVLGNALRTTNLGVL